MSDFQGEVNKHYAKQAVEMAKAHANKTILDAYEALQEENEKLKQRELELMAQVERLAGAYKEYCKPGKGNKLNSAVALQTAFNKTPQQSLAEHDAGVVESFVDNQLRSTCLAYGWDTESDAYVVQGLLYGYANQLRQQADKE